MTNELYGGPFLPVAGPVRKPTIVGMPVIVHDATRSARAIVSLRFDLLESSTQDYDGRYYGLDTREQQALFDAIGDLQVLSARWRNK